MSEAGLRLGDGPETLLIPFLSYEATLPFAQETLMHNCSFSAGETEGQLLLISRHPIWVVFSEPYV